MEKTDYEIEIVGMQPGDVVRINRNVAVRAHQATHRVAARLLLINIDILLTCR